MEANRANKNIQFFFSQYGDKRNEIFEYINNVLENENKNLEENKKMQELVENKNNNENDIIERINHIKYLTLIKYEKNFKAYNEQIIDKENEKNEEIKDKELLKKKYDLDLKMNENPFKICLIYYENSESLNNNDYKNQNINDDICNNINNIDNKKKDDNNYIQEKNNAKKCNNKDNEYQNSYPLFHIDFIKKIKICEQEEWICNAEYAFFLIYNVLNLNNPHPVYIDDNNENSDQSESSYSLTEYIDIERLVYLTNNRDDKNKKIIAFEGDINISDIYKDIKKNNICPNYKKNPYIQMSFPDKNILENINTKNYINNEVYSFFMKIHTYKDNKAIIFQDENIKTNFDKIIGLNDLYLKNLIRFLYLDLNIINNIKTTIVKRQYLAYYIARIYNCRIDFENDFEVFANDILKKVRDEDFINYLIEKILEKNNEMIENNKEYNQLYIVIDNINSEKYFEVFDKKIDYKNINYVKIFGVINIDSDFGQKKFIELHEQRYFDRGFLVEYLYSDQVDEVSEKNINLFLNKLEQNINLFKDFIQLLYYKDYIDECDEKNYKFLMKFIKYIKLDIKKDNNDCLMIKNIKFKSSKIEKVFKEYYKSMLMKYLNSNNNSNENIDKNLDELFSDANGIFFEKQIILDILLDKIKNENKQKLKFEELKVQSIYCMRLDDDNVDLSKYKNKNILITQISKTGEIYDFAIIIDNTVKLYQVSINKPEYKLIKLNKNLIEIDCLYSKMKVLNRIGEYVNFNFGLIISKNAFLKYLELIKKNDIKYKKTPYYLMKQYSKENKYEFVIYDLFYNKFYIEDNSYNLIEYNYFYEFIKEKKLNLNGYDNIFNIQPEKLSIKKFCKYNFIEKLKKTQLFSNISEDNEDHINIIAKFKYKREFLDIKKINEENTCLCISHETKKENKNIFIYKDEIIYNLIEMKNSINMIYDPKKIIIPKRNTDIILFNFKKDIQFLGIKRERDSLK